MHDSAKNHKGKIWDFFIFFLLRLFLFLGAVVAAVVDLALAVVVDLALAAVVVLALATPDISFKSSDLGSMSVAGTLLSISFFLLLRLLKVTKLEFI